MRLPGLPGGRTLEREYRRQRRASRKAHVRVFLEELVLIAFLGGVLVFGGYLLTASFTGPADEKDAEDGDRGGLATIGADQTRPADKPQEPAASPPADDTASGPATTDRPEPAEPASGAEAPAPERADSDAGTEPQPSGETPETDDVRTAQAGDTAPPEPDAGTREQPAPQEEPPPDSETRTEPAPKSEPEPGPKPEPEPEPQPEPEPEPEPQPQATPESTPEAEQASEPAPPAPITVERATFTYDVVYNQPRSPVTYIEYGDTQAGRLYFFTEVDTPGRSRLVHEWQYEGEVVASYEFEVNGDDSVSVSSYELPESARGTWRVYVRNVRGETIKIGTALYE